MRSQKHVGVASAWIQKLRDRTKPKSVRFRSGADFAKLVDLSTMSNRPANQSPSPSRESIGVSEAVAFNCVSGVKPQNRPNPSDPLKSPGKKFPWPSISDIRAACYIAAAVLAALHDQALFPPYAFLAALETFTAGMEHKAKRKAAVRQKKADILDNGARNGAI
jgi:hypothetical protein